MQPITSRHFLKVAAQRLTAAEQIMGLGLTLEAQYIGGYAVECSLKALILERTIENDRASMLEKLTHGAQHHKPEILFGILEEKGITKPLDLARRMRRFDWTTNLRYETGRKDTGETKALLRTAKEILEWVERQIS